MRGETRTNVLCTALSIIFGVLIVIFFFFLSAVPVGEPEKGVPHQSTAQEDEEDDGLGPINRELGLGTNEIDDFLGW